MEEITIKDVAKRCGVGISTVSRAINNHPDINPETKKMVMEVIRETGYIPNNSARNLKRTDAKCIAVLIKGITNPFFSTAISVIEAEVQRKKYALVMQHVEAYEDELEVALELVKEKRLRGIVFLGGTFTHNEEKLAKLNVPFVFSTIGTVEPTEKKKLYSNIAVDDRAESKKMVEYLLNMGHRKIAMIAEGVDAASVGQLRLEGYRAAFAERGLPVNEKLIAEVNDKVDPYSMENGYKTAQKLLQSGEEFTALFAIADFLAVGACRALYEAGKRIPEDVSVAGYDGIPIGEYYTPTLTTIRQPIAEMALKTVKLLLDVIEGKKEHEHIVFPASLVERESTAPPAGRETVS